MCNKSIGTRQDVNFNTPENLPNKDSSISLNEDKHFKEVLTFNDQCSSHIETSELICRANQLTGFYVRGTLTVKGLSSLRRNNFNRIILAQFNVNSTRNKFNLLSDGIAGNVVFISETRIGYS